MILFNAVLLHVYLAYLTILPTCDLDFKAHQEIPKSETVEVNIVEFTSTVSDS